MAICHCRSSLLSDSRFLFSSHWTQISSDIGTAMLLTTARWGLPVAHVEKRWLECCHLSTPSPTAACAGPACVQHALLQLFIVARPYSSCTCLCFSVMFCSLRFSHILLTVIHLTVIHLTAQCSVYTFSQARHHNVVHSSSLLGVSLL